MNARERLQPLLREFWRAARRAPPSRSSRFWVAMATGILGSAASFGKHIAMPDHPGDFGIVWFGAGAMLQGLNPYPLVGPGLEYDWPWLLLYPATAMVVAIPFSLIPQLPATLIFVFLSCALLGYAVTRDGWYRLPLFLCAPFLVAAGAAQWSPLFTAAIGIPALAAVLASKPNLGLAIALGGGHELRRNALIGAIALSVVSILMFPGWPGEWLRVLRDSEHMKPPLLRLGGPIILVALLRWRRADARLILAMACVPQTGSWYEVLPLFMVCTTRQETVILGMLTSLGFAGADLIMTTTEVAYNDQVGALMVALGYLPATIMVLRKPHERSGFFRASGQ